MNAELTIAPRSPVRTRDHFQAHHITAKKAMTSLYHASAFGSETVLFAAQAEDRAAGQVIPFTSGIFFTYETLTLHSLGSLHIHERRRLRQVMLNGRYDTFALMSDRYHEHYSNYIATLLMPNTSRHAYIQTSHRADPMPLVQMSTRTDVIAPNPVYPNPFQP